MTLRRVLIAAMTALLLLAFTRQAVAHDLGAMKVELIERAPGEYELSAELPPALATSARTIGVPERFTFDEAPVVTRDGGAMIFRARFRCPDAPLNAEDEIRLPWPRDGVLVRATWADGSESTRYVPGQRDVVVIPLRQLTSVAPSVAEAAKQYTVLGIEHILLGLDHLLFVLGLLLIVKKTRVLVETITAFTIAHSLTLAGATFGLIAAPPNVVDAAVALSIMVLGVEIIHARQGRIGLTVRAPWVVAFAFGLLHGFGFAGALQELGLPRQEVPLALLMFNVGVEIGQLMFVFAFLAIRWAARRLAMQWPRRFDAVPAYAIGTVASYWFIGRVVVIWGGAS